MADPKDPSGSTPHPPGLDELLRRGKISFQVPGMSQTPPPGPEEEKENEPNLDFDYTPKQVKQHLDKFVIGQDEAKKALSIAVCDHYNHVRFWRDGQKLHHYLKQNILLLGPTGVGKTYLIRCIAELIGVPFVKADATKFSETGYVGQDVDELVRGLVQQANGSIPTAEVGIIYLDEIDKIAGSGQQFGAKDVSGRGVQTNLLKLMEETEVPLRSPNDLQGQMEAAMEMMHGRKSGPRTINTRHILFIASGAFAGLPDIINRRLRSGSIGFQASESASHSTSEDDPLFHVATKDLTDYGFEPEFVGRLPVRVACHALTPENLLQILTQSEGSILRQYEQAFSAYKIDIDWDPEALKEIADRSKKEDTGARGLVSVLEGLLRDCKFALAGLGPFRLSIDREFLDNPESTLENWLKQAEKEAEKRIPETLLEFANDFNSANGLEIEFSLEAASWLKREAEIRQLSVKTLCHEQFRDLPYGLRLIAEKTGQKNFTIDLATAQNPDQTLSREVVKFYRHSGNTE